VLYVVVQSHPCDPRAPWRPVARKARNITRSVHSSGRRCGVRGRLASWPNRLHFRCCIYEYSRHYHNTAGNIHRQLSTSSGSSQWMTDTDISVPECVFIFSSSLSHLSYNHMSLSFPFSAVYRSITCICWNGIVNFITYDPNVNRIEIFNVTTDVTLCRCGSDFRRFEETSGFILKESSNLRGLYDPSR
jgi:hypothetical protein